MTTSAGQHADRVVGRFEREAARARAGTLFAQHSDQIERVCRALLRDRSEAEDALQQTFLSAYRALLAGTEPREAGAWLATIARNECLYRIRARMRRPIASDALEDEVGTSDVHRDAVVRTNAAMLWDEIASLPRQQRDAVVLREFGGLSYEELAVALGISRPAVESLLFRARGRLRTRLEAAFASLNLAGIASTLSDLVTRLVGSGTGPRVASLPAAAKAAAALVGGVAVVGGGAVVSEHGAGHLARPPAAQPAAHVARVDTPAHAASHVLPAAAVVAESVRTDVKPTSVLSISLPRHDRPTESSDGRSRDDMGSLDSGDRRDDDRPAGDGPAGKGGEDSGSGAASGSQGAEGSARGDDGDATAPVTPPSSDDGGEGTLLEQSDGAGGQSENGGHGSGESTASGSGGHVSDHGSGEDIGSGDGSGSHDGSDSADGGDS